jgi:alpha-methylacyl-CoA racemase
LAGIRVVDLSRLIPGAFCSLLLSDLGAEVTKVEHPDGGDGLRAVEPFYATGESAAHVVFNRGKGSVVVDVKTPDGLAAVRQLAADSDVVVESFRPGTLDRLGIGWTWLSKHAPHVVLASLSAYGYTGADARRSGHDLNALAVAGTLSLSAPPRVPDGQPADVLSGALAAVGILAALRERDRTGRGRHVDVALSDAAAAVSLLAAAQTAGAGVASGPGGLLGGDLACYRTYRCADGRFVAVGALEPGLFAALCDALGRPDLVAAQYDSGRQEEVCSVLAQLFGARSRADWLRALADVDAGVSPVLDLAEAAEHAARAGRHTVTGQLGDGTPVRVPGDFVRVAGVDRSAAATSPAPRLGEGTVGASS